MSPFSRREMLGFGVETRLTASIEGTAAIFDVRACNYPAANAANHFPRPNVKIPRHLPALGVAVSLGLFVIAASRYPGGTMNSATTVGYSWSQNFISSLFAFRALNGAPNPARLVAGPALMVLCLSLGLAFVLISSRARSRAHGKTIQIAGIGSMVYGALVATRMHDLMV